MKYLLEIFKFKEIYKMYYVYIQCDMVKVRRLDGK
jgi:hypothetical protein